MKNSAQSIASLPSPVEVEQELGHRNLIDFIRYGWANFDPAKFVDGWHVGAICEHLEAVARGEIRRLIINIPPRHMKSLSVAVAWPAWTWIDDPTIGFLYCSYAQALSLRDSVKCRRLIDSPWYQQRWGDKFRLTSDQNTKTRFENNQQGYRIASSVEGLATGEGGDIIVIDDPHNVREGESETIRNSVLSWWDEAMPTRLNDPKTGAYVIIMQRVHENDLVGHILAGEHSNWTHLCLPARYERDHPNVWPNDPRKKPGELLWSERFGEPEIASIETALGSYGTAGQLQQRPAPREGGMFERDWFEIVREAPADGRVVRFWDQAGSKPKPGTDPDYTAGVRMKKHDGIFYIEDVRRVRTTPQKVEKLTKQTADLDGKGVPIWIEQEPGSSGKATISHYQRNVLEGFSCRGLPSTGPKTMRADPLSAAAEAGNIKLVSGEWNKQFLDEIEVFPMGTHDDQVDSASGAHSRLTSSGGKAVFSIS